VPFEQDTTVFGTDLASRLKKRGFSGLFLIRTSEDSAVDLSNYLQTDGVDACLTKGASQNEMVASIRNELLKKRARSHIYICA